MDKEERERKQFLEKQLDWCKHQDRLLENIEKKLLEMKKIAQYILEHELTELENERLNDQFSQIKNEVHLLEKQLQSNAH